MKGAYSKLMIENPILRGFNPDPAAIRVGDDYYIATSTFEWWPGVALYHSKDLKHWELHSYPLNRTSQLDLKGVPNSGGVWAPCLSYDGKKCYLVYTNVRERGPFMQTDNYLVTTDDISSGVWSEPVYLNSMGFDPSLIHDDDGTKWLISLDNHFREGKRFNGLWARQYDPEKQRLVGELRQFYTEPHGELVEGVHMYKHNGLYYLLKAQGGTGFRHSAQLSRSKSLFGPYEDDPNIMLHSRDNNELYLQKAGHASLVDTPSGELYLVHLACRFAEGTNDTSSYFGRETCIQKVEWGDDGWLHLSQGGCNPHTLVPEPKLPEWTEYKEKDTFYDFRGAKALDPDFQTLRGPVDDRMSFSEHGMELTGGDGLNSLFEQTMAVRRLDTEHASIETELIFEPECEKHMAGLIVIYDTHNWHYMYVCRNNSTGKREICVLTSDNYVLQHSISAFDEIPDGVPVILRADIERRDLQFSYEINGVTKKLGEPRDMYILNDEHIYLGFTGTMVGICCQDMIRREKKAVFEYFNYERKKK